MSMLVVASRIKKVLLQRYVLPSIEHILSPKFLNFKYLSFGNPEAGRMLPAGYDLDSLVIYDKDRVKKFNIYIAYTIEYVHVQNNISMFLPKHQIRLEYQIQFCYLVTITAQMRHKYFVHNSAMLQWYFRDLHIVASHLSTFQSIFEIADQKTVERCDATMCKSYKNKYEKLVALTSSYKKLRASQELKDYKECIERCDAKLNGQQPEMKNENTHYKEKF
ncbi:hypothetical protein T11_7 [Trichinella zimbabwensis]|uniref:Uncharacterized protein n=1 Tax=Trichinella zimbabwensis TaxID=268475 RepID=A0A0V1GS46_9BILA|nr:hypothetical protein T11_7 [Trichinella zimbabwensis]